MAIPKGIYKRGGRFYVSVQVQGQQVRRSAGTSLEDAKRKLRELRARAEASHSPSAPLDEVLEHYQRRLRLTAKPQTRQTVAHCSRRLEDHFGAKEDADSLAPEDLREFIENRLAAVSRETVNKDLRVLKAALRAAAEAGLIGRIPFKVKLLKTPRRIPKILTADQIRRLLAAADDRMRIILLTAAATGMRHGELIHLWIRDLDFDNRIISVSAKSGWTPKSHCERQIPMSDGLAEALERHIAGLTHKNPDEAVFQVHPPTGRPFLSFAKMVRKVYQDAGLYDPALKPGLHLLRRSFASAALGNGADLETVRQLGGWGDLTTVQRYLSTTDDRKRRAVASLGL